MSRQTIESLKADPSNTTLKIREFDHTTRVSNDAFIAALVEHGGINSVEIYHSEFSAEFVSAIEKGTRNSIVRSLKLEGCYGYQLGFGRSIGLLIEGFRALECVTLDYTSARCPEDGDYTINAVSNSNIEDLRLLGDTPSHIAAKSLSGMALRSRHLRKIYFFQLEGDFLILIMKTLKYLAHIEEITYGHVFLKKKELVPLCDALENGSKPIKLHLLGDHQFGMRPAKMPPLNKYLTDEVAFTLSKAHRKDEVTFFRHGFTKIGLKPLMAANEKTGVEYFKELRSVTCKERRSKRAFMKSTLRLFTE